MVALTVTVSKSGCAAHQVEIVSHGAGLVDGIVDGEEAAGGELPRIQLVKVVDLPFLVGVQEDEVERARECVDLRMCVAMDQRDPLGKPRLAEVPSRQVMSCRIDLDRGQPSAGLFQGESHPDRRVSMGGAHLEDAPRPGRFDQEVQEFAIRAGYAPVLAPLGLQFA